MSITLLRVKCLFEVTVGTSIYFMRKNNLKKYFTKSFKIVLHKKM